jgi:hypothetical protein
MVLEVPSHENIFICYIMTCQRKCYFSGGPCIRAPLVERQEMCGALLPIPLHILMDCTQVQLFPVLNIFLNMGFLEGMVLITLTAKGFPHSS